MTDTSKTENNPELTYVMAIIFNIPNSDFLIATSNLQTAMHSCGLDEVGFACLVNFQEQSTEPPQPAIEILINLQGSDLTEVGLIHMCNALIDEPAMPSIRHLVMFQAVSDVAAEALIDHRTFIPWSEDGNAADRKPLEWIKY